MIRQIINVLLLLLLLIIIIIIILLLMNIIIIIKLLGGEEVALVPDLEQPQTCHFRPCVLVWVASASLVSEFAATQNSVQTFCRISQGIVCFCFE